MQSGTSEVLMVQRLAIVYHDSSSSICFAGFLWKLHVGVIGTVHLVLQGLMGVSELEVRERVF